MTIAPGQQVKSADMLAIQATANGAIQMAGGNATNALVQATGTSTPYTLGAWMAALLPTTTAAATYAPLASPTFSGNAVFTGPLLLSSDPVLPLGAATKHYVDANAVALLQAAITAGAIPTSSNPAADGLAVGSLYLNGGVLCVVQS